MDAVSFLSSPTSSHDSAVENLLSEILDVAAVEQIQRLPSPYDPASSILPCQIETRFQRLKSLNQTSKTTQSPKKEEQEQQEQKRESPPKKEEQEQQEQKRESPPPPPPPPPPPNSSQPDTPQKPLTGDALPAFDSHKKLPKSLPAKEFDHSWDSPSSSGSSSPPRKQGCCFWASPRKSLRKKGRSDSYDDGGWLKDDEMLSDLGTFSVRSQRERMKAAMKEQEKIGKEAEKVIKWVKQASARMSVNDLGDDLRRNK